MKVEVFMDSKMQSVEKEDENGVRRWFLKGRLHRINGPAVIDKKSGLIEWYLDGQLHKMDGPARKTTDGLEEWHQYGCLHRLQDEPAITKKNGYEAWYINGKLHRKKGPALIDPERGVKEWYFNGKLHRDDGPAIVRDDGTMAWFKDGKEIAYQTPNEDASSEIDSSSGIKGFFKKLLDF